MDIIENIDAIGRYTAGLDQQSFTQDAKTRDATITCLMRISEASTKLEKMAEDLAPDQPWQSIRSIGNRLRHEYHDVDPVVLWSIRDTQLSPLRRACEICIEKLLTAPPES